MTMEIEEKIFEKAKPLWNQLIPYGFQKVGDGYRYEAPLHQGDFQVHIEIHPNGKVTGKVTDTNFGDEYVLFRVEGTQGEYAHSVLEEYTALLLDIRNHCFIREEFLSIQANRLALWIQQTFQESVDYPWSDPEVEKTGVFREKTTKKWYAIIMELDGKRFGRNDVVNVMNVKLDPEEILTLVNRPGYHVCYHMNKKQWISIFLDDTLSDEEIEKRLQESRALILAKHSPRKKSIHKGNQ